MERGQGKAEQILEVETGSCMHCILELLASALIKALEGQACCMLILACYSTALAWLLPRRSLRALTHASPLPAGPGVHWPSEILHATVPGEAAEGVRTA